MAQEIKPASPAASGAAPPVANGNPANKPAIAPAASSALATVPLFGGNRGGKKRNDGLPPGSPEALEADRKKDAERKRRIREAAHRVAEPPPLPPALPAGLDQNAPPPGAQNFNLAPAPVAAPEIPWDAEVLRPLLEEAVDATEKRRVQNFKDLAEAAALGDALVKQIERDARYVPAFKSTVIKTGPRAVAKLLNRTGISGEYSDEALCALSVLSIWLQGRRLESQLQEMIENDRKRVAAQPKAAAAAATLPVK